jgi:hypothetical protein
LPHASVAVYVRVIVFSAGQLPGVTASLNATVTVPQSGLAVNIAVPVNGGLLD